MRRYSFALVLLATFSVPTAFAQTNPVDVTKVCLSNDTTYTLNTAQSSFSQPAGAAGRGLLYCTFTVDPNTKQSSGIKYGFTAYCPVGFDAVLPGYDLGTYPGQKIVSTMEAMVPKELSDGRAAVDYLIYVPQGGDAPRMPHLTILCAPK